MSWSEKFQISVCGKECEILHQFVPYETSTRVERFKKLSTGSGHKGT